MSNTWTWDQEKGTINQSDFQLMNPGEVERLNDCRKITERIRGFVDQQRIVNGYFELRRHFWIGGKSSEYFSIDCDEFKNYVNSVNNNGGNINIKYDGVNTDYITTKFDSKTNKVVYDLRL